MSARPGLAARRALGVVREELDDLRGRGPLFSPQPLGPNVDPARLAGYHCDFRHKVAIPRRAGEPLAAAAARAYHAGVIPLAQAGLGAWELLLEGRDTRADFLSVADHLLATARPGPGGEGVAWYTDVPVPKFGLDRPWPSAMGQSEAISVLLRAGELTGEARYAEAAVAAFAPFTVDVEAGGVARRLDGHLVLEEYPRPAGPAAVLNGWIFALFGLHELGLGAHRPARELLAASRAGLLALLPRYDAGWWSRYSLLRDAGLDDLAKPFYQRLHPVLLRALHRIAPDARLVAMAERWEGQLTALGLARASGHKLAYRAARSGRLRAARARLGAAAGT